MSLSIRITFLAVAALLLLSMIFFPFGYDQAVFAVAGELSMKHGAVTYRDFLDTKPPVIFIIYGISSVLFGHHEWSIRLFDILYHGVSLLFFYRVLRRVLGDETIAFSSVILYALFYTSCGFWTTAQAETFALLPAVWLFSATESAARGNSSLKNGIIAGVAGALLFLLKFTLLTIPAAAVIYILTIPNDKGSLKKKAFIGGAIVSLLVCLGAYLAYLYFSGAYAGFIETLGWLGGYSEIEPLFSSQTFAIGFFRTFPTGLFLAFGFAALLAGVIGMYAAGRTDTAPTAYHHLALQLCFGMLAVMLERKYFAYQYARLYWIAVPFIAFGLRDCWRRISAAYARSAAAGFLSGSVRLLLLVSLCCVGIFYSPVPRIITQQVIWIYQHFSGQSAAELLQYRQSQSYYREQYDVADSIRSSLRTNDQVFLWGNGVGLYYRLDRQPTTICVTNTPFVTSWTPAVWRDTLIRQLRRTPPRFFVVETRDTRAYITGDTLDSREHLEAWSDLASFLHTNYDLWKSISHFEIFVRRGDTIQ